MKIPTVATVIVTILVSLPFASEAQTCAAPVHVTSRAGGRTLYVSPASGVDRPCPAANGSTFRTLQSALSCLEAGDTLWLRGGRYTAEAPSGSTGMYRLANFGDETRDTLMSSFPGECAVLDGGGRLTTTSQSILELKNVTGVTIANLELTNTGLPSAAGERGAYGVHVMDSTKVALKGLKVHGIARNAIRLSGRSLIVEDNEVFDAVLANRAGAFGASWPAAVATWRRSDGSLSREVTFRRNRIHDVWGECLIALHLNGGSVDRNEIRNCFSTNLYVDNATRITVTNNLVESTNDTFNRPGRGRATGISISTEDYSGAGFPLYESGDITVSNNIVVGTKVGIAYRNGSGIADSHGVLRIAHNTVIPYKDPATGKSSAIEVDATDGAFTPANSEILNNILVGTAGLWIAPAVKLSWRVEHNLFSERRPAEYQSTNLEGDPKFVNAAGGTAFGYRVQPGSPAIGGGIKAAGVENDFFGLPRSAVAPTMGAAEDGVRRWTRQSGTTAWDEGTSIAVDALGSVFVGGSTQGALGGSNRGAADAVLLKYANNGNLLWARQVGSPAYDFGMAVAVDERGSAYIVGQTGGTIDASATSRGGNDAFLVKYLADGTKAFAVQFGTPGNDGARAVATDANGNVVVVGHTYGALAVGGGGNGDAFVAKYSWAGTLLWVSQLGTGSSDAANGVAVDADGTICVVGSTAGNLSGDRPGITSDDFFIARYRADGVRLWVRQAGGAAQDVAAAVALDGAGNIYASGWTTGSWLRQSWDTPEAIVVKYDRSGNWLWGQQLAPESGNAVAVAGGLVSIGGWTRRVVDHTNYGIEDAYLMRLLDANYGAVYDAVQFNAGEYSNIRGLRTAPDGSLAAAGHFTRGSDQGILVRMGY